jgi:predicted TIM-barrel fold metal-dependent hydrolase
MPSEVGRPIPYIGQVALDFPELVIVGGHIGHPWTEEAAAVSTKHPNVCIDTSAYSFKRYPESLVGYMTGHGRSKVLFGTNWPMIAPHETSEGSDASPLDAEARTLFLGGNAAPATDGEGQ